MVPFTQREKVMNIYSLMDLKLKEFGQLVLANNHEAVKRALRDGVPGSRSTIEKYPEDFNLYLLGAFDPETGRLVAEEVPVLVDNVAVILPPKGGVDVGVIVPPKRGADDAEGQSSER